MNTKKHLKFLILIVLMFPTFVFSQFTSGVTACDTSSFSLIGVDFGCSIYHIINVISLIIPILFALSFLAFFWGLSRFILNSGSPADVQKGKNYMIWGVVVLFVLISVRAIIGLIARDLEIGDSSTIPLIPTSTNSGQNTSTFNLPSGVPAP
ncbi:MAG: hypothetical protein AB201_02430 [Parcubacteria bacterium C7867-006]|nr:MAG: hypothetical protein AB201_02430 [Parcubacteria bacterium C7867-006]